MPSSGPSGSVGSNTSAYPDHLHENTDIEELIAIRDEFEKTDGVRVYFGCEADIDGPGICTIDSETATRMDYVMVAHTHFQHGYGLQPASLEPDVVADYMLELFDFAVGLPFADTIAHPFMIPPYPKYSIKSQELLTDQRLLPYLEKARENNVAMEISRRALAEGQEEFYVRFYRLCKRAGLQFSMGTDAHRLSDAGRVNILDQLIKKADIRDEDIWLPSRGGL